MRRQASRCVPSVFRLLDLRRLLRGLFSAVLAAILLGSLLPSAAPVPVAAGQSYSLVFGGPYEAKAGDTIHVTVSLYAGGWTTVGGDIVYDSSRLEFRGATAMQLRWTVACVYRTDPERVRFTAENVDRTNPISGPAYLMDLEFKVKDGLPPGTELRLASSGVYGKNDEGSATVPDIAWQLATAWPSTEARLASLTVANASFTPAFSPNTTNYAAHVPSDVSQLQVSAEAMDPKASVRIGHPALQPGLYTNVPISVTSESGMTYVYVIVTYRDPLPTQTPTPMPTASPTAAPTATPTPKPTAPQKRTTATPLSGSPAPTDGNDEGGPKPGFPLGGWIAIGAGLLLLGAGGGYATARRNRKGTAPKP